MSSQSQPANAAFPAPVQVAARPARSLWRDAFGRLLRNRLALASGLVILVLSVLALFAPLVSPHDPIKQNLFAIQRSPSWDHWLGTDFLGRDVLARLIYGARTSLSVGLFTQLVVLSIGLPLGAAAGYLSSRWDNALMRFTDVMYAFPDLLLIILLRAILGGSIYMVFLAIGLVAWVNIARLVRGQVLSQKSGEYVTAARALGASGPYILARHILPNALGPVIVATTFLIPRAIFAEAALSYIGIGVKPPTPSWGSMIQDGFGVIFAAPYLVLFPAIAIAVVMMAFTFLGDGLRDALDPRLRGAEGRFR
ncbi:MAG: ABC transporter permease [Chloroflexi bacterium]|nr:ABC transporter permease [Chloroflexota bacterium]